MYVKNIVLEYPATEEVVDFEFEGVEFEIIEVFEDAITWKDEIGYHTENCTFWSGEAIIVVEGA